nr:hypothetical protein [Tanacetum cinerariifolium]
MVRPRETGKGRDIIAVLGSKGDNITDFGWEGEHDLGTWNREIVYRIRRDCAHRIVTGYWGKWKGKTSLPWRDLQELV